MIELPKSATVVQEYTVRTSFDIDLGRVFAFPKPLASMLGTQAFVWLTRDDLQRALNRRIAFRGRTVTA